MLSLPSAALPGQRSPSRRSRRRRPAARPADLGVVDPPGPPAASGSRPRASASRPSLGSPRRAARARSWPHPIPRPPAAHPDVVKPSAPIGHAPVEVEDPPAPPSTESPTTPAPAARAAIVCRRGAQAVRGDPVARHQGGRDRRTGRDPRFRRCEPRPQGRGFEHPAHGALRQQRKATYSQTQRRIMSSSERLGTC